MSNEHMKVTIPTNEIVSRKADQLKVKQALFND